MIRAATLVSSSVTAMAMMSPAKPSTGRHAKAYSEIPTGPVEVGCAVILLFIKHQGRLLV
jgi:hypothetical protein